jgi:cobalamin biosynthesis Mg chelatase CobN
VRFLRAAQRPDGGFAQMASGDSNAQSTAWAVQGLVAVGRDPRKFRRSRDPLAYLRSLQAADGSVRYSRTSTQTPVWVTAQALVALEEKPFPLRPATRKKATTAATASAARASESKSTPTPRPRARGASRSKSATATRTAAKAAPRPQARPAGVQVARAAATTPVDSAAGPAQSQPKDKPSRWPLVFMAALGVAAIVGLRLAWRRE